MLEEPDICCRGDVMTDLIAIAALGVLCAGWMGFQLWLKRVDPHGRHIEREGCGGCNGGSCRRSDRSTTPRQEHAP
jgi:hypothetical protein